MKLYTVKRETMSSIADAIRTKRRNSEVYTAAEMATAITQIGMGSEIPKFNIAYGDTEPEGTGKLWVKTEEPAGIHVRTKVDEAGKKLEAGIAELPKKCYGMATAAAGTKVYMFGGYDGTNYLNSIYVFDSVTNSIVELAQTIPAPATHMVAAAVGTNVYVFGGNAEGKSTDRIRIFDTQTNTLSVLDTALPYPAFGMAAAVVGKKVYLFGGYNNNEPVKLNTIQVFDTETGTATLLNKHTPNDMRFSSAATVGGKVYLFGGEHSVYSNTIYMFDPEATTITLLSTTLPTMARDMASAVFGTKVYLFGGHVASNTPTAAIHVFDAESNTLTTLDATLPTAAAYISAGAVGGKVYLFGGYSAGKIVLSAVNAFLAILSLEQDHMLVETSFTDNLLELIAGDTVTVELGVANVYRGNADGVAEKVAAAVYKDGDWKEI